MSSDITLPREKPTFEGLLSKRSALFALAPLTPLCTHAPL